MEFLTTEFTAFGGTGILLALFFGTFVSEDVACISAGSLIASHAVDPVPAVAACFTGIVVGDVMLFGAGRIFGRRILESSLGTRFVQERSLERASEWLSRRGFSALFISRFVSGLRLPVYFLSGVLRLDSKQFVLFVAVAAAVWTPLVVGAAALWQMSVPFGAIAGLIIALTVFRYGFRLTDVKRRRILAGRIKRIWQWEFWPLWLFYAPVLLYVIYLSIRYRGLHFTAANPGMPAGGFVGESKDAIYKLIALGESSADQHLLRYVKLSKATDLEDRVRAAVEFLKVNSLSYPAVVKPDAGERGNCVSVVRSEGELRSALNQLKCDALVQEFANGVEASVFYYRYPGDENGCIFSITEKVFPFVVGDGVSTVEELILADRRAHIIADSYFKRNHLRLFSIPRPGEKIALVDIGSHSKGAIFRDGTWIRTSELETPINDLSRGIPGFYFGRYDLSAESFAELSDGNFKIIELNGVTSESTNIYDPRYSLIDSYEILFSQWRIAFDIGLRNSSAGVARASVIDLISLFVSSKRLT